MSKTRAVLQLVRFPAVFSAMADIGLGFLLTHNDWLIDDCPLPFALLLASTCGLYLAGMALNDVFDRQVDAQERPLRPIPSGRVSLKAAVGLSAGLIIGGLVAAAFVGLTSLIVAGLIVVAVLAYDGSLKKTPVGPVSMGSCRFLNVLLGASAGMTLSGLFAAPQIWVALSLGVYIAGLTWFARNEAGVSHRTQLIPAMVVINTGLIGLVWLATNEAYGLGGRAPTARVVFAWAMVAIVVNRGLLLALSDPQPELVQRAVKTMIQWLIVLDAVMIYAASGNPAYAIGTAALIVPAMLIGRWVFVT